MTQGGNSLDILDTINDINLAFGRVKYECVGLLDDEQSNWGNVFLRIEALGGLDMASDYGDCQFVFGIGSPSNFLRKSSILARTHLLMERDETIVHPTASVRGRPNWAKDRGLSKCYDYIECVDRSSGGYSPKFCHRHDDVIGDLACITGGVCILGRVSIGRSCYLGTNCTIRNNLRIGDCCFIGMGSVVSKDVENNSLVAGNPARFVRKIQ